MTTTLPLHSLLEEILTVINYPSDKDVFIREFEALTILEAMTIVYKQLPEDKQQLIQEHSDNTELLIREIPKELYEDAYLQVAKRELKAFIQSFYAHLDNDQKQQLDSITFA